MQLKSISEVNDVDLKSRTVAGYAAVFDQKDLDGDVITKSAFTRSLNNNSHKIFHLYQHNKEMVLGLPKLSTDNYGLKFRTEFPNTSLANDVLKLYDAGILDSHSIGFQTVKAQRKSTHNEISEVKLFEISTVSWAANPLAIGGIEKAMQLTLKAFRHGQYENEFIYDALEERLTRLQELFIKSTSPATAKVVPLNPAIIEVAIATQQLQWKIK